ncbi:hypothetical protein, partial [uncultured Senegalimassilia sp.]|uniref:hypothetical protein n=1 Tax=uncultured Senegalimassilia sp. TaxID=1714350 RepID=UPI00261FD2D9
MANNETEQLTAAPSAGVADEMEGKAGASLKEPGAVSADAAPITQSVDSTPAAPVFTVSGELQPAYG